MCVLAGSINGEKRVQKLKYTDETDLQLQPQALALRGLCRGGGVGLISRPWMYQMKNAESNTVDIYVCGRASDASKRCHGDRSGYSKGEHAGQGR